MDKKEFLDYLKKGGNPYLKIPYNKEEIEPMIKLMEEFFNLVIDIHDETIRSFCLGMPNQTNIIKEYPIHMHFDSLAEFYNKNH